MEGMRSALDEIYEEEAVESICSNLRDLQERLIDQDGGGMQQGSVIIAELSNCFVEADRYEPQDESSKAPMRMEIAISEFALQRISSCQYPGDVDINGRPKNRSAASQRHSSRTSSACFSTALNCSRTHSPCSTRRSHRGRHSLRSKSVASARLHH